MKKGATCPRPILESEKLGFLGRVGTYSIKLQCHALFYGEFHAEQESEIRFALSRILDLLPSRF